MTKSTKNLPYIEFPSQVERQFSGPLDKYAIFDSLEDAQNYAMCNPLAYKGQIIAVVDPPTQLASEYVILNDAGFLDPLATSRSLHIPFIANEGEMLSLEDVTKGLIVFRVDTQTLWMLNTSDPSELKNWSQCSVHWKDKNSCVGFYCLTQAQYDNIPKKDPSTLYFISDLGKVYKGIVDMTCAVEVVNGFDTAEGMSLEDAVNGRLYISPVPNKHKLTGGCRIKLDEEWIEVNPGYYTDGANWATADSGKFATIGLIKQGIAEAISDKAEKMGEGPADKVVLSTEDGNIKRSESIIGSDTFNTDNNTNILATEAGVLDMLAWKNID